jgi:hypothetical protein
MHLFKTITLSQKEIFEAIEAEDTIKVSERAGKHDCTIKGYVFKKDGKHWIFYVNSSYNEGIQDESVTATWVEPRRVVVTEWAQVVVG